MRLLPLVALAACANLPPLATGVCGNGVLEPGEDCDHAGADCDRCQLVCAAQTDCDAYPGYRCGADQRCHAPGGAFTQAGAPFPVSAVGYRVMDFDQDQIGDVVALSPSELTVHFGDDRGRLDAFYTTVLPGITGEPAFGTVGATPFLALPTRDGVAEFRADGRVLVPYPFAADPSARAPMACSMALFGAKIRAFTALDTSHLAIVSDGANGQEAHVLDITAGSCGSIPLCDLGPSDGNPILARADVSKSSAGKPAWLLAAAAGSKVCVVRITEAGAVLSGSSPYSSSAWTAGDPPVFARLSSPDCPSLVQRRPQDIAEVVAIDSSGCTLTQSLVALGIDASRPIIGSAPLVPAISGYMADALVQSNPNAFGDASYVWRISASRAGTSMFTSIGAITGVTSGDVDGDGTFETIVARFDGIDVLFREGIAGTTMLPYRLATAGRPLLVTVGDYDGNGRSDVAYIDKVGADYKAMVAFGTPDRPAPATQVASLQHAVALATIGIPDSIDPGSQLDDLLAVGTTTAGGPVITILHGSPQRVLLAYYDPRAFGASSEFVGAVSGNFIGDPNPDLMVIEAMDQNGPIGVQPPAQVWAIPGTSDGGLDPSQQTGRVTGLDSSPGCTNGMPCAQHLAALRWPLADHDVVVAVDIHGHLITLDPNNVDGKTQRIEQSDKLDKFQIDTSGPGTSITAADLDGDGHPELVLGFALVHPLVVICKIDDTGIPTQCDDLVASTPDLDSLACSDAKPAHATAAGRSDAPLPDQASDLIALCSDGGPTSIYRVHTDHGAGYTADLLRTDTERLQSLEIGDVTGDAVDDLVVRSGTPGLDAMIHVWPQCEARDVVCRAVP